MTLYFNFDDCRSNCSECTSFYEKKIIQYFVKYYSIVLVRLIFSISNVMTGIVNKFYNRFLRLVLKPYKFEKFNKRNSNENMF